MIVIYFQSFHGSFRFASVRPISFLLNFVSTNTLLGGDSVSGVLPNFTRNSWRPVAFCHIFDEIKMLFLVKRQSQLMHRHQIHGLIFSACLLHCLSRKTSLSFADDFHGTAGSNALTKHFIVAADLNLDWNTPYFLLSKTETLTVLLFEYWYLLIFFVFPFVAPYLDIICLFL